MTRLMKIGFRELKAERVRPLPRRAFRHFHADGTLCIQPEPCRRNTEGKGPQAWFLCGLCVVNLPKAPKVRIDRKARETVIGSPKALWVKGYLMTPEWDSKHRAPKPTEYDSLKPRYIETSWDLSDFGDGDNVARWARLPVGQSDRLRQAGLFHSKAHGSSVWVCLKCRTFELSRRVGNEKVRAPFEYSQRFVNLGLPFEYGSLAYLKTLELFDKLNIPKGMRTYVPHICHRGKDAGKPGTLWYVGAIYRSGNEAKNRGLRNAESENRGKWGNYLPPMPWQNWLCPKCRKYHQKPLCSRKPKSARKGRT